MTLKERIRFANTCKVVEDWLKTEEANLIQQADAEEEHTKGLVPHSVFETKRYAIKEVFKHLRGQIG